MSDKVLYLGEKEVSEKVPPYMIVEMYEMMFKNMFVMRVDEYETY